MSSSATPCFRALSAISTRRTTYLVHVMPSIPGVRDRVEADDVEPALIIDADLALGAHLGGDVAPCLVQVAGVAGKQPVRLGGELPAPWLPPTPER